MPQRCQGSQFNSILYVVDREELAAPVKVQADQVNPPFGTGVVTVGVVQLQEFLRNRCQSLSSDRGNGFLGTTVGVSSPRLDLDEYQYLAIAGNDIHLSSPAPEIGGDDVVALVLQVQTGLALAPATQLAGG